MKHLPRLLTLILFAVIPMVAASQPVRTFENGQFVSSADPALEVRIAPEFDYLGSDSFTLHDRAAVERHIWVKAPKGEVEALIVFQFEGLMDGIEGAYSFRIPDGGNLLHDYNIDAERVRLGALDYVHSTWAFDVEQSAREAPEAESARTVRLMVENGLKLPAELMMSRYVTEIGPEKRDELILFYMEPVAFTGKHLSELENSDEGRADYAVWAADLTARGLLAFRVAD
jgi:hypothetical protein